MSKWQLPAAGWTMVFALAAPDSAAEPPVGPLNSAGGWTLVFTDEFEGSSLDTSKWTTCYWWADRGCTNLATNELQWYRERNVAVAHGNLHLTARREEVSGYRGRTFPYTSGMVTSGRYYSERDRPDRFSFTYGYVEVRALFPPGQGLWPAIWMMPSTHESLPEIDIMEVLGRTPDLLRLHYHYEIEDGVVARPGRDVPVPGLAGSWNVYGLEWSPRALIWYLNGEEQWRIEDSEIVPHEPMYLLLNLAVGGDWAEAPDATTDFPAEFLIDYVRVWERDGP
jgi:beta-glucanase (GH16 family)